MKFRSSGTVSGIDPRDSKLLVLFSPQTILVTPTDDGAIVN